MGRPKIPTENVAAVLIKSARRCCLCFGLNGDFSEKKGQIAHVDHNPANNSGYNLVFLCLEHHDAYDSSTSQSKGLTREEIEYYRAKLFEAVEIKLPRRTAKDPRDVPAELEAVSTFLEAVSPNQPFRSSLLSGYEIQRACQEQLLTIDPFSPERLTGSGYRLSCGEDALIDGRLLKFTKQRPLELTPSTFVTLSTEEVVSIPHWLLGRVAPLTGALRLGLSIESPGHLNPGFRGRLLLTAQNRGLHSITVVPGLPLLILELWLLN